MHLCWKSELPQSSALLFSGRGWDAATQQFEHSAQVREAPVIRRCRHVVSRQCQDRRRDEGVQLKRARTRAHSHTHSHSHAHASASAPPRPTGGRARGSSCASQDGRRCGGSQACRREHFPPAEAQMVRARPALTQRSPSAHAEARAAREARARRARRFK
eukprot:6178716-Pleurochrysis_carterae.AAC.2